MGEQRRAVVFLVLTAMLWSTGGLLIKGVDWSPLGIAGTRSAIAALVLLAVVRRRNFTWSAAQIGGAIAYAATVVLFVVATKLTTAANAILIQYTAPIYIALFSPWFLKERARRADWLIMAVMLGGLVLFFLDKLKAGEVWGNVAAVLSGVSFAWLALFLRKQKAGSPMESVFLGNVIAAAVCLPWVTGPVPGAAGWWCLAALGVVQISLAYMLYTKAIRHVTALEAMLIPALEPILNPALVYLVHGEQPGAWALAGGAVVLAAVAVRAVLTARGGVEAVCGTAVAE